MAGLPADLALGESGQSVDLRSPTPTVVAGVVAQIGHHALLKELGHVVTHRHWLVLEHGGEIGDLPARPQLASGGRHVVEGDGSRTGSSTAGTGAPGAHRL